MPVFPVAPIRSSMPLFVTTWQHIASYQRIRTSQIVISHRLRIYSRNMFHVVPVGFPDAQDLKSPLGTVPLHSGNHPAHHTLGISLEEWSAILLPQGALIPQLESPVNERWFVVIQIIYDEMLFTARLGLSPRAGDSCIELEDQASVVAYSLASGVQSFANTKACAECIGAGDSEER